MNNAKVLVKRLLPTPVKDPVLNMYHFVQAVAANIRYGFPARGTRVIMVTGTNGKTTTAAFVARMLAEAGETVGAVTTAFYMYGDGKMVPNDRNRTVDDVFLLQKMLARMRRAKCTTIVLEVTSHALMQYRVWGVPCEVAVMTNLTRDHLDYHKTMQRYAAAKGRMFARKPPYIVLNRDDEWFNFYNKYSAERKKISYGVHTAAWCQMQNIQLYSNGSDVQLQFEGAEPLQIHSNLPGKFNVYNMAAAACVGYCLQLSGLKIKQGLEALQGVPGRVERVSAGQPFEVVVDYAHTPDALTNLLGTLRAVTTKKIIIVFGATGDRDRLKRPIMGEIAAKMADYIVVTDEESYSEDPAAIRKAIIDGIHAAGAKSKMTEIADRREAIAHALQKAKKGDIVVLTGMGHELYRNMGGQKIAWNEAAIARECLQALS